MLKAAPKSEDVTDFQFKLQCRFQIFDPKYQEYFSRHKCSLVATASRFGLIFIGNPERSLYVATTRHLEDALKAEEKPESFLKRTIPLEGTPSYLALNCEHTVLAVVLERDGCPWAKFYDVKSFVERDIKQLAEARLSATPEVTVLDVNWNPTIGNLFTACKSDGTLGTYEVNPPNININEIPAMAAATCFSWSPKGKQIAVGSRDGRITQYKPDLKAVKVVNGPPFSVPHTMVALQWVSNYQFIGLFRSMDQDGQACLVVIDSPKTGDCSYTNYDDICFNSNSRRPLQYYPLMLAAWNLLLVASSNSMEVGVLGATNDEWKQLFVGDSCRAELPLSPEHDETLPIGLALDTSTTDGYLLGETKLDACPMLLILSDYGTLCCFAVLNLKPGQAGINTKSELSLNAQNLAFFQATATQPPQENVKPLVSAAPVVNTPPANLPSKPFQMGPPAAAPGFQQEQKTLQMQKPPQIPNIAVSAAKTNIFPSPPQNISTPAAEKPVQPPQELDDSAIYMDLIRDEKIFVESSIKAILHQGRSFKMTLGVDADKTNLSTTLQAIEDFFKEIQEICGSQASEVHTLKQNLLQSWAWYADAEAHYKAASDNSNVRLLRARPLDAASQKRLEDIHHGDYYLQSQIAQAHRALDEEWERLQDYCRKHQVVETPTMEMIFQTMVKQNTVLLRLNYVLKDIGSRIKNRARNLSSGGLLIAPDFLNLSLEGPQTADVSTTTASPRGRRISSLSKSKTEKFRSFLANREIPHVAAMRVNVSTSVLETSPMKAKKDLETLRQKSAATITPILKQEISTPTKPLLKMPETPLQKTPSFALHFNQKPVTVVEVSTKPAVSAFAVPQESKIVASTPVASAMPKLELFKTPEITKISGDDPKTPSVAKTAPVFNVNTSKPGLFPFSSVTITPLSKTTSEAASTVTTAAPTSIFTLPTTSSIFAPKSEPAAVSISTPTTSTEFNLSKPPSGGLFANLATPKTPTAPEVGTFSEIAKSSPALFPKLFSTPPQAPAATTTPTITTTTSTTSTMSFGSLFGQAHSSDNKKIFGNTPSQASQFQPLIKTPTPPAKVEIKTPEVQKSEPPVVSSAPQSLLSAMKVFAATTTATTAPSVFGGAINTTQSQVPSIFGAATGTTTTGTSIFGSPSINTQMGGLGFGAKTEAPAAPSIFGDTKNVFGQSAASKPASTASVFGAEGSSSSGSSLFSTAVPPTSSAFSFSSGSVFGNALRSTATTTASSGIFTTNSNSPGSSVFSANKLPSVFGASEAPKPFSGSVFQTPPPSTANNPTMGFGGLTVSSPTSTSAFGGFNATPATTQTQQNIFSSSAPKPQDTRNIFGSPATPSNSGSIFGNAGASVFGAPPAAAPAPFGSSSPFGQAAAAAPPSPAQSPQGMFSSPVSQSGFGAPPAFPKPAGFGSAPVFGNSPVFGSSPAFGGAATGAFGAPSAFGAAPAFSPTGNAKIFGSDAPAFGSAAPAQNVSFGNLANQPVVGFGNLAQGAAPSNTGFSASSSFSNWR